MSDPVVRVQAILAGEREPTPSVSADLDALLAEVQPQVVRVCRRIVGDPDRAEDIAQEALLVAWRKLPEYDPSVPFRAWVFGIARNLALNAVRKRTDALTEDGLVSDADPAAPVLRALLRREREELLREASLAVLDAEEQEVVYLRYTEGLSQERITELLALPGTGARGVLQRCRRKLARELEVRLAALGHGASFVRSETD